MKWKNVLCGVRLASTFFMTFNQFNLNHDNRRYSQTLGHWHDFTSSLHTIRRVRRRRHTALNSDFCTQTSSIMKIFLFSLLTIMVVIAAASEEERKAKRSALGEIIQDIKVINDRLTTEV